MKCPHCNVLIEKQISSEQSLTSCPRCGWSDNPANNTSPSATPWNAAHVVIGLLLVTSLFIALRWNNFNAPLIRDEGEYAYAAQLLNQGIAPYEQAFIQKPPMVIYSYALAYQFFADVFWAPRILAYLFVAMATVLLGYVAQLEFGKLTLFPTMLLATPMILLPQMQQFTSNTEMFMLLPLMATVTIYCHSRQRGHLLKHWFAAGFLAAVTMLYKYTALPMLAFVFIAWFVELWRATKNPKRFCLCFFSALLGCVVASSVFLGFFLLHDGGARLWECTVALNRYYVSSNHFGWMGVWNRLTQIGGAWWFLFLIPWFVFLAPQPKPRLWFWLGMFASALLSTSRSPYGQYYICMMPFLALLDGVGLVVMAQAIASRWKCSVTTLRRTLTGLILLLVLWPDARWMTYSPEKFAQLKMGVWSPFLESQAMAEKIIALSQPTDPVFIAGSEPQILHYARRKSSTRFITVFALSMPSPIASQYQHEVLTDLQNKPPRLVVLVQLANSWSTKKLPGDFMEKLNAMLHQDYEIVGGFLTENQKGQWTEPLEKSDLARASMILFKRKAGM